MLAELLCEGASIIRFYGLGLGPGFEVSLDCIRALRLRELRSLVGLYGSRALGSKTSGFMALKLQAF